MWVGYKGINRGNVCSEASNSRLLKGQGRGALSEAWRGKLFAGGCLIGDVAFSPGTLPTPGDLRGREFQGQKIYIYVASLSSYLQIYCYCIHWLTPF